MKKYLLLLLLYFIFKIFTSFCLAQNKNIDSVFTLLRTDKPDTNKVNHLSQLTVEFETAGDYETALKTGKEALELAGNLDFKMGISKVENSIGNIYRLKAEYPKALEFFLKALKISETLKDKKGEATFLGNIGTVYVLQNDYDKALNHYLLALKISQEIGDKNGLAGHLGNIGSLYLREGFFDKALEYYFKSQKMYEELGQKRDIAINLSNIGLVYLFQSDYKKALDVYLKALKINEELGTKSSLANCIGTIGSIYMETGNFKEAEQYLKTSISMNDSLGSLYYLMQSEEAISSLYDTIGRQKLALIHYKKAIALKDTIFSQENKKQLVRKELNFEFEKKEAITKAGNEKEQAIAEEKSRKQNIIIWSVALGLLLVVVFAGFVFRSLRNTRKQKSIIEKQKNEVTKQKDIANSQRIIAEELREIAEKQKHIVEEKQKEIVDSITYAKRIQTALLTSEEYIKNNLPAEHFILFKPKDIVSGDFYWALRGPSKRGETGKGLFYIATADCTGHGVPGAFMSMLNISYLNENVIERGIRMPNDILDAQRAEIIKALNPLGSTEESKDGMDCTLCVYDFDNMLMHFAAANNSLWLIRKKSLELGVDSLELAENNSKLKTQDSEIIEYNADKMPVGLYTEGMKPFTLQTIELQEGDIIYTSTDGFADQFGGISPSLVGQHKPRGLLSAMSQLNEGAGKKLMKKKFKEELLKIHKLPMSDQKQYLNQFFENWKGDLDQVDDVCVVGIRV